MSALSHCTVVDLTTQLPGPYGSMLLADFGADVIKVEPPAGDPLRAFPGMFASVNRGKRSLAVNLKTETGRTLLARLFERADVVLEGFRPGVAERLGADYAAARRVNPDIVYCAISGFGQQGPYRDRAGHDINYLALGGLLGQAERCGRRPSVPPLLISDLASGLYAAVAILAALMHRDRTGEGGYIDLSMTETVLAWMAPEMARAAGEAQPPDRPLLGELPHYGVFETADGGFISLGIVYESHFWQRLCDTLGLEAWRDLTTMERMAHKEEIREKLEAIFLTASRAEWDRRLQAADVPCGPVYDLKEAAADPQFLFRQAFFDLSAPDGVARRQVGPPYRFSHMASHRPGPPPGLGEHTAAVLRQFGCTPAEVEDMIREGVVKTGR
jgi:crotonobetainyl-CoA:carnitine CoA-transferase CaiB-like acyl-CoA transferase